MVSDSRADAPAASEPSVDPIRRPDGVEARRHRRARAHWAVRVITASGSVVPGWVCDVSEGGVGLMSSVHMPVGSIVDIALAVPHGGANPRSVPVRCKVRVVFCAFAGEQSRLGVQFTTLPTESRVAIRSYVMAHS